MGDQIDLGLEGEEEVGADQSDVDVEDWPWTWLRSEPPSPWAQTHVSLRYYKVIVNDQCFASTCPGSWRVLQSAQA